MAYTYIGKHEYPNVTQSFWNGSSWSTPIVGAGPGHSGLGVRQGIDPIASGRFDKKDLRINDVKIIRETRTCTNMNIVQFKPHPSWGITLTGPVTASYWMLPGDYLPSTLLYNTSIADYLIQKSLSKLTAADFDGGTNVGELRETLQAIIKPLSGIREMLAGAAKGKSKVSDILDAAASTRLEWQYGVRPLISTVEDLLDIYRNGLAQLHMRRMYRKRSSFKKSTADTLYRDIAVSSLIGRQMINVRADEKYTCGIYYKYNSLPTLQERMGLDIRDLPGVAWELIGLSFVWDWFLGIGNWIQSLRNDVHRTILGAYVSHKVVHTVQAQFIPGSLYVTGQPTWRPQSGAQSTFISVTEYLERRGVSIPTGFYLPAFNPNDLGLSRQLDSLALLWQRLPRR